MSDQFLMLVPGGPTQVFSWRYQRSVPEAQVILIPIRHAADWVSRAVAPDFLPRAELLSAGRYGTGTRVRSGALEFIEACEPWTGREGGLGSVGGADGVGIGGGRPRNGRCKIQVSLAQGETDSIWAFKPELEALWVERVSRSGPFEISQVKRPNRITGVQEIRPIDSLEAFFTLLSRPGAEAVEP